MFKQDGEHVTQEEKFILFGVHVKFNAYGEEIVHESNVFTKEEL